MQHIIGTFGETIDIEISAGSTIEGVTLLIPVPHAFPMEGVYLDDWEELMGAAVVLGSQGFSRTASETLHVNPLDI